MLREGTTVSPNTFIDARYWLDWFVDAVQRSVWSLLLRSGRVPQTSVGISQLTSVVEDVCRQGERNGGIAAGTLTEQVADEVRRVTSSAGFDGVLTRGYLVYIEPITNLTQEQISSREVPPIHVWLKGSGAVHYVDIDLTFN